MPGWFLTWPHVAVLLRSLALCRIANSLRALLPEAECASLEKSLTSLAPLFDLATPLPADASTAEGAELAPATQEAVAAGHALIEELAAAGCERADALAQAAADSAAQLVAAPAAAQPSADGSPGAEAAGDAPPPGGSQPATAPAALKALAGLHADGVKSVAELCSLCLERLLALGRSISSFYRYSRPADDGIAWPAASEACGRLLRGQALRQLEDLQAMAAAFGAALASAGGAGAGWRAGGGKPGATHSLGALLWDAAPLPACATALTSACILRLPALAPPPCRPPAGQPVWRCGLQRGSGAPGQGAAGGQRGCSGAHPGCLPLAAAGGVADQRPAQLTRPAALTALFFPDCTEPCRLLVSAWTLRCSARM